MQPLRFARALAIASTFSALASAQDVHLRWGTFDPLRAPSDGNGLSPIEGLAARPGHGLWIVQCERAPTQGLQDRLRVAGGEILSYLPERAFVVRGHGDWKAVEGVRAATPYHPAFRAPADLLANAIGGNANRAAVYNIVLGNKRRDRTPLNDFLHAIGAEITNPHRGGLRIEARLTSDQLIEVLHADQVLWVDAATEAGVDMDHARIQGGAHHIDRVAGYRGQGLVGHSYETLESAHPDFSVLPTAVGPAGAPSFHGHAVAGILFGNGTSHPRAQGLVPDVAGIVYTDFRPMTPSRYMLLGTLANTTGASLSSASWGHARTSQYTSVSAALDDALFDHDVAYCQSMSNSGQRDARPESWAKNVMSVGSVRHLNNADPTDDSAGQSGSSRGPAADGRFAPTLVSYGDDVWTSDLQGPAGLSALDHAQNFGGTSAATAIVGGYGLLATQMFTDGLFGNPLRNPGGTRHSNRPHISTLKALMVASAAQYSFGPQSTDNTRNLQGWGHPNIQALYEARARTTIDDHNTVLLPGATTSFAVAVTAQDPVLKVCIAWPEPPANPAAATTLVNDLDLRVTSPSGVLYLGNDGLDLGMWSAPAGTGSTADTINPLECVFVQNPQPGAWTIEVRASAIAIDNHPQTATIDAVFGLVALAGDTSAPAAEALQTFGAGCGAPGSSPDLALSGTPRLGGSIQVSYTGLAPQGAGLFLFNGNDLTWSAAALDLPVSLTPLGLPGCVLYVDPNGPSLVTADGSGAGSINLPVPSSPTLVGTEYTCQIVFADPTIPGIGAGTTPSGRILIGR